MCGKSKQVAAAVSPAVKQEFNKGQLVVATNQATTSGGVFYYRRGDIGVVVSANRALVSVNFDGQPGNSTDLTPSPKGCGGILGWDVPRADLIALNGVMVLKEPEVAPKVPQGFTEGAKVKVVRKVTKEEGYENYWVSEMDRKIGDGIVYTIKYMGVSGVQLEEDEDRMGYPQGSLELVTEEAPAAPAAVAPPVRQYQPGERVKLKIDLSSFRAGETVRVVLQDGVGYVVKSIGCGPERTGWATPDDFELTY